MVYKTFNNLLNLDVTLDNSMSTYKPYPSRKKAFEDVIKDLSPGVRELAKELIEEKLRNKMIKMIQKRIQNSS